MTRTLSAAMQTAVAADQGYADIWLLVLTSSGGTTRVNSSPQDALWNGNTYTGIGGAMSFVAPTEISDPSAQGFTLNVSGVDQTIVDVIVGDDLRGRACTLYFGQVLLSTGVVTVDPIEIFAGLENELWTIREEVNDPGPDTVEVSTRIVSELTVAGAGKGVSTNMLSHRAMLDRDGLAVTDTFFQYVPELIGKTIVWGEIPFSPGGLIGTPAGGLPPLGDE